MYIDLFAGTLTTARLQDYFGHHIIRVSPIVLHELYRGTRTKTGRRSVDKLANQLLRIEPPSWERAWITAGQLLPELFPDHESVGLAKLQNDLLLALTARSQGTILVSRDKHFSDMQRLVTFRLELI